MELVTRIHQIVASREKKPGRPPVLGLYESVVLTLVVLRSNISQMVAAELVGISQPTVSRIVRRFTALIDEALCMHTPPLPEIFRGRLVLVDGTLIPTGNRAGQRLNYSGKRHKAGLGLQVAADHAGTLLAASHPYPGSVHDRRAFTETGWEEMFTGITAIADPGYQGTDLVTPRRKPPGGELSTNDKTCNKEISQLRAAVERAIAHLKNWKILATGYRGRLAELPTIIRLVTRLEYYRLGW